MRVAKATPTHTIAATPSRHRRRRAALRATRPRSERNRTVASAPLAPLALLPSPALLPVALLPPAPLAPPPLPPSPGVGGSGRSVVSMQGLGPGADLVDHDRAHLPAGDAEARDRLAGGG